MMGSDSVDWVMEALLPPGAWMHLACKPLIPATWADLTGATRFASLQSCSHSTCLLYCTRLPLGLNTVHAVSLT